MKLTLNELYLDYVVDWLNAHDEGKPVCFDKWIHNEFAEAIDSLPFYNQCILYNECARYYGWQEWKPIDDLIALPFKDVIDYIDKDNFDIRHDLYIDMPNGYQSFTYAMFLEDNFELADIVEFIKEKGLENLDCYELLNIRVV